MLSLNSESFFRWMLKWACIAVYAPDYSGFEHIPESGAAVLISNHVSYADGLIINSGCKREVRFVIDRNIYQLPFIHYLMTLNRAIPIEPTRSSVTEALDAISAGLEAGDIICIFPEGQLTYTGGLGRFKTGIEAIIRRNPVPVYPIALTGLWGSMFSRKYRGSWRRLVPKNPFRRVKAVCGAAVLPEMANVNFLQEIVMRLKYHTK